MILYVPLFNRIFSITPLTFNDWILVLLFSTPIILVDEVSDLFRYLKLFLNFLSAVTTLTNQRKLIDPLFIKVNFKKYIFILVVNEEIRESFLF